MSTAAPPQKIHRPAPVWVKCVLLLFSTAVALVGAELVLRLQPVPVEVNNFGVQLADQPTVPQLPDDPYFAMSEVEKAWFDSLPSLKRYPIKQDHIDRLQKSSDFLSYCCINEEYIRKCTPNELRQYFPGLDKLDSIYTFRLPSGTTRPPYRFPVSATLPCGLTTNQFGFRGPQIDFIKPPRTIRIACVGASTTVSQHGSPYSYPELLQHWLNLWAQHRKLDVAFEVLNAGRSGIKSTDIAAVVRDEVLPLDCDYVIYYEGANQFYPLSVLKGRGRAFHPGQPPKPLYQYLEITRRLAQLTGKIAPEVLTERPRPAQEFVLPDGVDEFEPDLHKVGNALDLTTIMGDLDRIKAGVESRGGGKLLLSTFVWLVHDGLELDPSKPHHRAIHRYLNVTFWPASYKNMRRLADFQNRVFQRWAEKNGVDVLDIARHMPQDPDLFFDAIHNTPAGIRVRAWVNFKEILPLLERDLASGTVPRAARPTLVQHPNIHPDLYGMKQLVRQNGEVVGIE